jgi:hypothetical protein
MTSETVSYGAAKIGGLSRKPMAAWIASAVKPSRKGVFRRKAEAAGMSTAAYAKKEAGASGKLGKEARLAETFARFRPKKKKGSLRDHLARMRAAGRFGKGNEAA